jgi:hypothetical protein
MAADGNAHSAFCTVLTPFSDNKNSGAAKPAVRPGRIIGGFGKGIEMGEAKHSYRAHQLLPCPRCYSIMEVSRRSPHPTLGAAFEIQPISCSRCDHQELRAVDPDGKVVG